MSFRVFLFGFILSFLGTHSFLCAMLMSGDVLVSPDKSRYVPLLGHDHDHARHGWKHEKRQLRELVALCKEGIKLGKKIHILYEKFGDAAKFYLPRRSILAHLEETFKEEGVDGCIIENVEIRDCSLAAWDILNREGKGVDVELGWNENSKPFGQLTFQDVFNEFDRYAGELEPYAAQHVQNNPECPNAVLVHHKFTEAQEYLDEAKAHLEEIDFPAASNILEVSSSGKADCVGLRKVIRWAFSSLFDLHIFRKLMNLDPAVQPIVIAGAMHTHEVGCLLRDLKWNNRLSYGCSLFIETPIALTYSELCAVISNETACEGRIKKIAAYYNALQGSMRGQFNWLCAVLSCAYCN